MLDYHLHLWPHGEQATDAIVEQLTAYCEKATAAGVEEIAVTEHLFRFVQADRLLGGFWADEPDPRLAQSMAQYWKAHAHADLDHYVECALAAKVAGLPVVVGLEVDYYRGRMHEVGRLLAGYPFDVLLGSVHWLGTWRFDDLDDTVSMDRWTTEAVEAVWDRYTEAIEELAASGTCDVLAHPDLVKVTGRRPAAPEELWDRIAEAAASSGMAAEVSSAGWRKPVGSAYPDLGLLERFARCAVPVTTASDAHRLAQVAERADDLATMLRQAGIDSLQAYRGRVPRRIPLTSSVPGP
ncbi:MAG TPA: histidinol-phosphatase [Acidimicrobiales bacterium]|nr:histidinol-phosphatase [Acidimicrobiales bacterium]